MKQHNTNKKEINGVEFYIRPFPAFTAANMSGELVSVLAPSIGGIVPLVAGSLGDDTDIMNLDVSSFSGAMSGLGGLSGDKVENLLKKLLTKHRNISVETEDGVKLLDDDLANEVFCGSVQDMFILAVEVININFKGFFSKIANQFGLRKAAAEKNLTPESTDD